MTESSRHHEQIAPMHLCQSGCCGCQDLTNSAMEAGTKPAYVRGRPDVRPVLKEMQLDFSHLQNIHVYVAGKGVMDRDVSHTKEFTMRLLLLRLSSSEYPQALF